MDGYDRLFLDSGVRKLEVLNNNWLLAGVPSSVIRN